MKLNKKISICIPTWEQGGNGSKFLKQLLDSLSGQTYKNFNVFVSDHSENYEIENLILSYKSFFEINYFRNKNKKGNSPANTNFSISKADGDIIKILFQDDFLYTSKSLEIINEEFKNSSVNWVINGSNHTKDCVLYYNTIIPKWNNNIIFGVNTISSPSVLSFLNLKDDNLKFDENLIMMMDCEYYYQLFKKFGLPHVISETLTTNRIHENQISSEYDNKNFSNEINYIKNKYKI